MSNRESTLRKRGTWLATLGATMLAVFAWSHSYQHSRHILTGQQIVYSLFDLESDPLAVMDEQGEFILWNAPIVELTGYTKEEINETGVSAILHADDNYRHKEAVANAFRDPENHTKITLVNCHILRKNNPEPFPVVVTVRVVETYGGVFAVARILPRTQFNLIGLFQAQGPSFNSL